MQNLNCERLCRINHRREKKTTGHRRAQRKQEEYKKIIDAETKIMDAERTQSIKTKKKD